MARGPLSAAIAFLNHLIAGEDWGRERLKPFVGKTVRLTSGAFAVTLEITADGLFGAADADAGPAVTITLPADAPLRALGGRAALLASAQVGGSAELAETLSFIFRSLRWDVEADLARIFGDIVARRLVDGGRQLAGWQAAQARNLAANLAEYFTEENPLITRQSDVARFCADVGGLGEPLAALERRIAALEG